ncbi:hypothetical protein N0V95_002511 [Ascochyta clinopodiicola]|nr:hypothetical protein N0V95_002511 [Ascochyta clinopodiicola]
MPPIPFRSVRQPGLKWTPTLWGNVPEWTAEPSFDIMKKLVVHHLGLDDIPEISFFTQGALNKLYAFDCHKGSFLMRVTLPAAPGVKTESEAATLAFIREKTTIPVPQVFAHDSNSQNELGFEWIIMQRIDAQPLHQIWHEMSWLQKQLIVQKLAVFWVELFNLPLSGIGSICSNNYHTRDERSMNGNSYTIGETVLPRFFIGDHVQLDIDRGPYNSGRNYLNACLDMLLHDATTLLASDDEDDVEHGQDMQEIYEALKTVVPLHFPHTSHRERTLLCHRDISISNILVDSKGDLVSIVDWECVAAVPLWQACDLPQLLHGRPFALTQMPPAPTDDFDATDHKYYKENRMSYELAQLRTFFLEEMQRICPVWMEVFRRERLRHDILLAVEKTGNDGTVKWVKAWLKALMQGDESETSLTDGCRSAHARQKAKWIWE